MFGTQRQVTVDLEKNLLGNGIESLKYVKTMVFDIFKKNSTSCFKSDLVF